MPKTRYYLPGFMPGRFTPNQLQGYIEQVLTACQKAAAGVISDLGLEPMPYGLLQLYGDDGLPGPAGRFLAEHGLDRPGATASPPSPLDAAAIGAAATNIAVLSARAVCRMYPDRKLGDDPDAFPRLLDAMSAAAANVISARTAARPG